MLPKVYTRQQPQQESYQTDPEQQQYEGGQYYEGREQQQSTSERPQFTSTIASIDLPLDHPALRPLQPATEVYERGQVPEGPLTSKKSNQPIVHERIEPIERYEIQPVIERKREQYEIEPVLARSTEQAPGQVKTIDRQLKPEYRELREESRGVATQPVITYEQPRREIAPIRREIYVKKPIVRETVLRHQVQEVQPVIERQIQDVTIVHAVKPVFEHVIENPRVSRGGGGRRIQQQQQEQPVQSYYYGGGQQMYEGYGGREEWQQQRKQPRVYSAAALPGGEEFQREQPMPATYETGQQQQQYVYGGGYGYEGGKGKPWERPSSTLRLSRKDWRKY